MEKKYEEEDRELTPAEQRRLERFEQTAARMKSQGYKMTELTVGIVKANVIALVSAIPIFGLGILLFFFFNRNRPDFQPAQWIVVVLAYLALIVVHELIHGITWSVFAEHHWKDIEFGFMKSYFTPYCTCAAPLTKGQYIVGALMPLLVLGIVPTVVSFANGSFALLVIGLLMILGAMGDVMIVSKILAYRSQAADIVYMDHPTLAGGVIFER